MEGHQGQVVIGLPAEILPSCVILEHVEPGLTPAASPSSAPKEFAVFVSHCFALLPGIWAQHSAGAGTGLLLGILRALCPAACRALQCPKGMFPKLESRHPS